MPQGRPRVVSREVFLESCRAKSSVSAATFYGDLDSLAKVAVMSTSSRSDAADERARCFSSDNGRSWSEWEPVPFITRTDAGVHRVSECPGWVDPCDGPMLVMAIEGSLPTDSPLEGMKHWVLRYRVSLDAGRSFAVDEPVVQRGEYTADHPLDGVWVGRNCFMIGAVSCRPIRTAAGHFLVPVQITPIGPDGEYYNPGGGYTYHEAAVLIGTWADDGRVEWDLSQRVANDPAKSTRGCVEPTLAEMPDGRILMVMRGSNDAKPHLPARKWFAVSDDAGRTWTAPRPWTYAGGGEFSSPSSCSQLLRHSSGRYYWLGNICPGNARGNRPRYPLVIGEVDPEGLGLVEDTVAEIDTLQPGEDEDLQLSNFFAYEDRESHEVLVHVTRLFHVNGWRGDAHVYRLAV